MAAADAAADIAVAAAAAAIVIAAFLPYPLGVNPTHLVIEGVRTLLALHGTRVEVQSPDASILINIF